MQALVHIEPSEADTGVIWWAEIVQVPGFYAAASSLPELRVRVMDALQDIASDVGHATCGVTFHLATAEPGSSTDLRARVAPELKASEQSASPGTIRSPATLVLQSA